jgi:hypothetical protein
LRIHEALEEVLKLSALLQGGEKGFCDQGACEFLSATKPVPRIAVEQGNKSCIKSLL